MQKKVEAPSRREIWKMFDQISPTYDCANKVMTFRLDDRWRKQLCAFLPKKRGMRILDCATGTGDQILAILKKRPDVASIIGVDLSEGMLEIGKKKITSSKVAFQVGDSLSLPFDEDSFDAVTISFGIRNVENVSLALREMHRVLVNGGRTLILEGTLPGNRPLRALHLFYLRHILPRVGGWISKNQKAYRYLNETIETFPQQEEFCTLMRAAGFVNVKASPLLGGVATVYQGDKNAMG
ncbi:MAG: bifunctional demethylmenaquinone methyltransferase/2-methoxy-6-polyprenyl-1,4-benzoquinol methylase UbiE [Chlamydiota bacterium]